MAEQIFVTSENMEEVCRQQREQAEAVVAKEIQERNLKEGQKRAFCERMGMSEEEYDETIAKFETEHPDNTERQAALDERARQIMHEGTIARAERMKREAAPRIWGPTENKPAPSTLFTSNKH